VTHLRRVMLEKLHLRRIDHSRLHQHGWTYQPVLPSSTRSAWARARSPVSSRAACSVKLSPNSVTQRLAAVVLSPRLLDALRAYWRRLQRAPSVAGKQRVGGLHRGLASMSARCTTRRLGAQAHPSPHPASLLNHSPASLPASPL